MAALALLQTLLGWGWQASDAAQGPEAYDVAVMIAMYSVVKYADRLRDGIVAGGVAAVGVLLGARQAPGPE